MEGWGARPVLACSGDTPTEQGAGLERLPDRANNLDEHCDAHDVMMLITHQYERHGEAGLVQGAHLLF